MEPSRPEPILDRRSSSGCAPGVEPQHTAPNTEIQQHESSGLPYGPGAAVGTSAPGVLGAPAEQAQIGQLQAELAAVKQSLAHYESTLQQLLGGQLPAMLASQLSPGQPGSSAGGSSSCVAAAAAAAAAAATASQAPTRRPTEQHGSGGSEAEPRTPAQQSAPAAAATAATVDHPTPPDVCCGADASLSLMSAVITQLEPLQLGSGSATGMPGSRQQRAAYAAVSHTSHGISGGMSVPPDAAAHVLAQGGDVQQLLAATAAEQRAADALHSPLLGVPASPATTPALLSPLSLSLGGEPLGAPRTSGGTLGGAFGGIGGNIGGGGGGGSLLSHYGSAPLAAGGPLPPLPGRSQGARLSGGLTPPPPSSGLLSPPPPPPSSSGGGVLGGLEPLLSGSGGLAARLLPDTAGSLGLTDSSLSPHGLTASAGSGGSFGLLGALPASASSGVPPGTPPGAAALRTSGSAFERDVVRCSSRGGGVVSDQFSGHQQHQQQQQLAALAQALVGSGGSHAAASYEATDLAEQQHHHQVLLQQYSSALERQHSASSQSSTQPAQQAEALLRVAMGELGDAGGSGGGDAVAAATAAAALFGVGGSGGSSSNMMPPGGPMGQWDTSGSPGSGGGAAAAAAIEGAVAAAALQQQLAALGVAHHQQQQLEQMQAFQQAALLQQQLAALHQQQYTNSPYAQHLLLAQAAAAAAAVTAAATAHQPSAPSPSWQQQQQQQHPGSRGGGGARAPPGLAGTGGSTSSSRRSSRGADAHPTGPRDARKGGCTPTAGGPRAVAASGSRPGRSSDEAPDWRRLFVGNIGWWVDEEMLLRVFGDYGTIMDAQVMWNTKLLAKGKRVNREFAFISYTTPEEAGNAIRWMHGRYIEGLCKDQDGLTVQYEAQGVAKPPGQGVAGGSSTGSGPTPLGPAGTAAAEAAQQQL